MSEHMDGLDMSALGRLVPVTDAKVGGAFVPTCNARELHAYLEVKRDFSNWIKGRIAKYGFREDADFVTSAGAVEPAAGVFGSPKRANQNRGGDRRSLDYFLTLDMAKELAMVENNPMGRAVRRYFIECERRGVTHRHDGARAIIPLDPAWAAWLSLSTDERRTRQRDALIYKQAYGATGLRIAMHQNGMPTLPSWAVGAREQHELDLMRREGVTVTVTVPSGGS